MSDSPVEAALDELYAADPSEFVATRKQLAAGVREAGDKAGAKLVLAARRPSTSAWALNQLARREPALVEELLDASRALYAAQTRGSNKADVLRDAIREHREALDAATLAATAVLGERSNDGFRNEIVSTLRAVSTDEAVGEQLRSGRVVREASASGFPDTVGLTLVPDLPDPRAKAKPKPAARAAPSETPEAPPPDKKKAKAEEKAREKAREKAEAAKRAAAAAAKESARREAEAAAADAERAHARVEELEGELALARRELTQALVRSRKAKSTVRDLR